MLKFALSRQYRGMGGSEGLERGLLVYDGDTLLVEEGMGLGAIALQAGGFTYFATMAGVENRSPGWQSATGSNPSGPAADHSPDAPLAAAFHLDRRLVWKVLGRPSIALTRLLEAFVTHGYMKFEWAQRKLLSIGALLTRLLRVQAHFEPAAAMGEAAVSFQAGADHVDIAVDARWNAANARLFIMNELGGVLFAEGLADGRPIPPPSGWQRLSGPCELHSRQHRLAFTIEELAIPAGSRSHLYWGREVTDQFCWAGFESELACNGPAVHGYRYRIRFRRTGEDAGQAEPTRGKDQEA